MNKSESQFLKKNEVTINKNIDFNLKRAKLSIKLIFLLLIVLIENYKINILKIFIKINIRPNKNAYCNNLDPIKIFSIRLENKPITICQNKKSKHICYQNSNDYYNKIFYLRNGILCKMENIVLDPSKSKQTNIIYKGPVDKIYRGRPILSKGFFNIKCKNKKELEKYNSIYKSYFQSWNYDYNNSEKLEELAKGKIIFFISRNQDSPNIFHGISELINSISIMELFHLYPENIQIVFLESMTFNNDPFYDLYRNIVSRGGEPIYIKNLKKKYLISNAFHIPINLDSAAFIHNNFHNCQHSTKTYNLLNDLVKNLSSIPKTD